jgi:hypothetical protein
MRITTYDALNHLLSGLEKLDEAEMSALAHTWTAIAMLHRLSPGWRPGNKQAAEMVAEAEEYLAVIEAETQKK